MIFYKKGQKMDANSFWDKIKKLISAQGKTFVWLCEQAGVSVQIMKNRIYKERIPDVEDTLKLLAVLGTTVEEFFGVEAQFPVRAAVAEKGTDGAVEEKIPIYEQIFSCGHGQYVPDTEIVENYITVPEELRGKKFSGRLAASRIRGDSMEPTIFNGDTVICDNLGFQEDGIYAIIYQGKGFVKRLQTVSGGMKIISDNPAYEPMLANSEADEFKVIGRVHYVLHKL